MKVIFPRLADAEQKVVVVASQLPSGTTGIPGVDESEGTSSYSRTDVSRVLERYHGEIADVEDGLIFSVLRDDAETYRVELSSSDFELWGPLSPGQTFEAQWVRLESGAETWRCIPDPPRLPDCQEVRSWIDQYAERYDGTGL